MPLRPHRRRCGVGDLLERQAPRTLLRRQVLTGNPRPLGDQDSVGCNAKRCMVVEAPPPAALVMTEPKFLFEFQIGSRSAMEDAVEGAVGVRGGFATSSLTSSLLYTGEDNRIAIAHTQCDAPGGSRPKSCASI